MATLVEAEIINVAATVVREEGATVPQLLITADSVDDQGEIIRHYESGDLWEDIEPTSRAAILQLYEVLRVRILVALKIPPYYQEPPPEVP